MHFKHTTQTHCSCFNSCVQHVTTYNSSFDSGWCHCRCYAVAVPFAATSHNCGLTERDTNAGIPTRMQLSLSCMCIYTFDSRMHDRWMLVHGPPGLLMGLHARLSCTCFASRARQVQDRSSRRACAHSGRGTGQFCTCIQGHQASWAAGEPGVINPSRFLFSSACGTIGDELSRLYISQLDQPCIPCFSRAFCLTCCCRVVRPCLL